MLMETRFVQASSPDAFSDPETIEAACWTMLQAGAQSHRHPFHLPVMANPASGSFGVRTVVLRQVNTQAKTLGFHTDIRSGKWAEMCRDPRVSWLFYAQEERIQLRLQGIATCYTGDAEARRVWDNSPLHCRRVYMGEEVPGHPAAAATHGLPPDLLQRVPSAAEAEQGWKHFGLVITRIERMEWLKLSRSGHLRAGFQYGAGGALQAEWLVP